MSATGVLAWIVIALAACAIGVIAGLRTSARGFSARQRRLQEAATALLERARPLLGLPPLHPETLEDLAFALQETGSRWHQAWRASQEERRRLRSVLGGLVDGILLLDREGRIVLANDAARAIWPRLSPRILGMHQIALFHDSELDAALHRSRAGGAAQTVVHMLPGPPRRHLEVRILPLPEGPVAAPPSGDEGAAGTLLVMRDVSDRHAVDQMRRDFVANVSHELQTPLTTIRGFAETLAEDPDLPDADRQRFLGLILREAERMTDLVRDLLELARLEGSAWRKASEPVDLAMVAREVCDGASDRAARAGLRLTRDLAAGAVVPGDSDELRRALDNLVANAIAYTPRDGQVTVRVGSDARGPFMAVSDTGIGIPRRDQNRIFERFYRVDKGRSRESGGTGLGLSIVRHVVESHGGRVVVESEPGEGSTFTCVFPHSPAVRR